MEFHQHISAKMSPAVLEHDRKLTLDEKMKMIDQEVKLLLEFCKKSGISDSEMRESATPLFRSDFVWGLKDTVLQIREEFPKKSTVWKILFCMVLLGSVFHYDPTYRFTRAHVRMGAIKVLAVWDWRHLFYDECIIANPYYIANRLYPEDCMLCRDLHWVERIENITHDEVSEDYVYNHVPFIITDAMAMWTARESFTPEFIEYMYRSIPPFNNSAVCYFENYPAHIAKTFSRLLKVITKEMLNKKYLYNALWENCNISAVKAFRRFLTRPYFLPPMVELTDRNWVGVSSGEPLGNMENHFITPEFEGNLGVFTQIQGNSEIQLTPLPPCNDTCGTLTSILQPGELIVYSNFLWEMSYRPSGHHHTVNIGFGAIFDQPQEW